jgi:hypothetical protein
MKTKLALIALAFAATLTADVLKTDTAVFVQTDPKSPVLARLKAGATVTVVGEAPAGWRRVEVSGPFEGYSLSRDITKGLDVREGGNVYAAPRKDAQVLAVAGAGDKFEVTGLAGGDWCQVRLDKNLQGFIAVGEAANIAAEPKPAAPTTPVAPVPAPAAPTAPNSNLGRPVPITGNTADMPRGVPGTLVLARRPILNPNPPYDYQLIDTTGRRFAYVDTKRLVLTDKIENFLNQEVIVTGTLRNTVDGKDLVVAAESVVLKK